ncbi:MAG: hypothetical protein PHV93_04690 [Candidatus Pacebacteria bacterium]|nr:hypothetical protein [Candidatus Paceibacterota bacterium]
MVVKFCTKCKQQFDGENWAKVCKPCYAEQKRAEDAAKGIVAPIEQPKDRVNELTAGRIARSTALAQAVETLKASKLPSTTRNILELALVYAKFIQLGEMPAEKQGEVSEEKIEVQ